MAYEMEAVELNHRLALAIDRKIQAELADLGIRVPLGFVGFDVSESANSWPSLEAWIRKRQPNDLVRAKFSDEEIGRASWVALRAGSRVVDIGEPPGMPPSDFYRMELGQVDGYWNYFRDMQP